MKNFAKINLSIWSDNDFQGLSAPAQHLYFLLLSHPTITQCGVVDWRPKRLAAFAAGLTVEEVEEAASELVDGLFIIVDEDTEECLIRSFLRNDGTLRQPNLTVAMTKDFNKVASATIRGVIAFELGRLRHEEPDLPGWSKGGAELSEKPSVNPSEMASRNPSRKGSEKGSGKGSGNPLSNPSGKGYQRGCEEGYERGCHTTNNKQPTTNNLQQTPTRDDQTTMQTEVLDIEDHPPGGRVLELIPTTDRDPPSQRSTYPDEFEEWWSLYPKKVGKGAALKAWRKATHDAGGASALLAATRQRVPAIEATEPRYRPNPSTWLNQARYHDPIQDEPAQQRGNAFLRLIDRNQATTDQEAINEHQ